MKKMISIVILLLAGIIGSASFIAFLTFLYAGPLNWVQLDISETKRLVLNMLLSLLFFLQHSSMVRKPFRQYLNNFFSSHYQGAIYTIASGLTLLIFVMLWQGTDRILLAHGLTADVMRSFYILSLFGMCWGMWALRSADIFSLDPIIKNLANKPVSPKAFIVRGPYRWVRHPLYFFMIVLFWSYPVLTTDRLLFNTLWTIWVVIGTILEERDLVADIGNDYRAYQKKVPMLLPRVIRMS